jgi:hypothetical protein
VDLTPSLRRIILARMLFLIKSKGVVYEDDNNIDLTYHLVFAGLLT